MLVTQYFFSNLEVIQQRKAEKEDLLKWPTIRQQSWDGNRTFFGRTFSEKVSFSAVYGVLFGDHNTKCNCEIVLRSSPKF